MVRSWCLQQLFFDFFPIWPLFSRKSDKNRGFVHISSLYIKVGQILGLSKNGSWVLVDAHRFFYGSWIRACTGSFGDVPKYFGLLKEVGHIAKWWVFTEITLFGSNFFRSVIRACTGSFANVYPVTSPLFIKVGQILGLSENGSWVLVDACRFFYGSWIRACTESFGDVPKYFGLLKEVGYIAKWWVFTKITFFGSNFFRSVIRACTGSFANVYPGTSPLFIKVGQILGLSKNGSWALVDARNFFFLIY